MKKYKLKEEITRDSICGVGLRPGRVEKITQPRQSAFPLQATAPPGTPSRRH